MGEYLINAFYGIGIADILDILIVAFLVYKVLVFIRKAGAQQLMQGIILLVAAMVASDLLNLHTINWILRSIVALGAVAILIIFQPELRRALEKFGRTRLGLNLLGFGQITDELSLKWESAIEAICDSCVELSASATGALIVVERQVRLGEQIETGTVLNATPSKEVFGNIFYPKTPLHDGAVIMRDGIILAAACFLPKPQNDAIINKKLGSRHRAAIGMSENSDAIVIVVSEETGQISVAMNGVLTRDYTRDKLEDLLRREIYTTIPTEDSGDDKKRISSVFKRRMKK